MAGPTGSLDSERHARALQTPDRPASCSVARGPERESARGATDARFGSDCAVYCFVQDRRCTWRHGMNLREDVRPVLPRAVASMGLLLTALTPIGLASLGCADRGPAGSGSQGQTRGSGGSGSD